MKSPVAEAREKTGVTRKEFAFALDVSYYVLHAHETELYTRMTPQARNGPQRMGLDAYKLAEQCARWRQETDNLPRT